MTLTESRPTPTGVSLTTPPDWYLVPLDTATRNERIAALVDERIGTHPELAGSREILLRFLRAGAREAASANAVLCALWSETRAGRPLAASATVVVTTWPPDAPVAASEEAVAEQLRAGDPAAVVQVVQLARADDESEGRSAVRLAKTMTVALPEDRVLPIVSVQYYLLFPAGGGMAVLNLTTPSMVAANQLIKLFDAMALTFRLTY